LDLAQHRATDAGGVGQLFERPAALRSQDPDPVAEMGAEGVGAGRHHHHQALQNIGISLRDRESWCSFRRLKAPGPFLLVQLSDLHLGADWSNGDPLSRLADAVAAVGALPQQPAAVLVSGDLTEDADPAGYEAAREALAALAVP